MTDISNAENGDADAAATEPARTTVDPAEGSSDPTDRQRGSRARRTLVSVLVALGLICGVVGNASGFAWWFLFDTDNFVSTVGPLSENDKVSSVLAARLVDEIVTEFDVEDSIADALPDKASFLAGPITSGAEGFATDATQSLIQSDAFTTVWERALTRAQRIAVGILRDEGEVLRTSDGQVVLDLSDAATSVSDALSSVGLDLFDPDDVSDDFGRIVLLEDDQLASAQTAVRVLDLASFWLPLVALGLWAIAIVISRNRRRTTALIGLALSIAALTELVLLRVARNSLLDNIVKDDARGAVEVIWDELTDRLREGLWALIVFGLVVALIAYAFGDSPRAARIRSGARQRLHEYRGEREPGAEPDLLERVVRPYRRAFQVGVFVLALVYLLQLDAVRAFDVLVTAVVLVAALAFIEFAAGPKEPVEQPTGGDAPSDEVEAPTGR